VPRQPLFSNGYKKDFKESSEAPFFMPYYSRTSHAKWGLVQKVVRGFRRIGFYLLSFCYCFC